MKLAQEQSEKLCSGWQQQQHTLLTESEHPYERRSRARDASPKKQLHWKCGNRAIAALESPPGLPPLASALGGDGGGGGGITQVPNVEFVCNSEVNTSAWSCKKTHHYLNGSCKTYYPKWSCKKRNGWKLCSRGRKYNNMVPNSLSPSYFYSNVTPF